MRVNCRLVKDDRLFRANARREIGRGDLPGLGAQFFRFLPDSNRMHVHDAEKTLVLSLQVDELADGPEVIAKMHVTGWLDARKHPLRACIFAHMSSNRQFRGRE